MKLKITLNLVVPFFVLLMSACSSSSKDLNQENAILEKIKKPDTSLVVNEFPSEEIYDYSVLKTGFLHNEEVRFLEKKWLGLFKGDNAFYIKQVKVSANKVYDPVVDENENQKTGWEVKTNCKDSCIILMQEKSYIKNHNVATCKLPNTILYPNEEMKLNFEGVEYTFWAKGIKQKAENGDWFEVRNYRIFLTARVNGKLKKSLLIAHKGFNDCLTEILFAGDIDGDGKLDLIINTSNHYNAFIPTIYLSKPAKNNELVTPVGGHVSYGC